MAKTSQMGVVLEDEAKKDLRIAAAYLQRTSSRLVRDLIVAFLRGEINLPERYLFDSETYDYDGREGNWRSGR